MGVLEVGGGGTAAIAIGLSVYCWRSSFAVEGYLSVGVNEHYRAVAHGNSA